MDTLTVGSGASITKIGTDVMTMSKGSFLTGSFLLVQEGRLESTYGIVVDGSFTCSGPASKGIYPGDIEINGSMDISASGPFELSGNTLHIGATGTLGLEDGVIQDIGSTAELINDGLMDKGTGTGDFILDVRVENSGTIDVSAGDLVSVRDLVLLDGTYNVGSGSSFWTAGGCEIPGLLMDTLTGVLDGPLILDHWIRAPLGGSVTLDFMGAAGVEWAGGDMENGDVINEGLLTITGTGVFDTRLNSMTLVNNGTIDITSPESFKLVYDGYLHNTTSGTINLLDGTTIQGSPGVAHLINEGTVVKTASGERVLILAEIVNDGGTFEVLGDTLSIGGGAFPGSSATLVCTDGVYHVSSGATLLQRGTWMLNGTATGQLDGPLVLSGGPVDPTDTDTGVFQFSGMAQVHWEDAVFGTGNFINLSTIHAVGTSTAANSITHTHFINRGMIDVDGYFGLLMSNTASLFNSPQGVIRLHHDNHLSCGQIGLTNRGLIEKEDSVWTSLVSGTVHHDQPGLIRVRQGTLKFDGLEPGDGDLGGGGRLDLGNYTVQGEVFPGNSPGSLSITGNYTSSPAAVLQVELNGTVAGTEYDVLAIDGAAVLNGDLQVTLGFAPAVNDQFQIVTATSIDTCMLPASVTTAYNGDAYTFAVICATDHVSLSVISVGVEEMPGDRIPLVHPNPTTGLLTISNADSTIESIRVLGAQGQEVYRLDHVGRTALTIDLSGLSGGVYMVLVNDRTRVKVIKE